MNNSLSIIGLSAQESIAKIKAQLAINPDSVMVTTDTTEHVKEIARAIGSLGYRFEMWPADGVNLFVFSRLKL